MITAERWRDAVTGITATDWSSIKMIWVGSGRRSDGQRWWPISHPAFEQADVVEEATSIDLMDFDLLEAHAGSMEGFSVIERLKLVDAGLAPPSGGPHDQLPTISRIGLQRIAGFTDTGGDELEFWVCEATMVVTGLSIAGVLDANHRAIFHERTKPGVRSTLEGLLGVDMSQWDGPFVAAVIGLDQSEADRWGHDGAVRNAQPGEDPDALQRCSDEQIEELCITIAEQSSLGISSDSVPDNSAGIDVSTGLPAGVSRRSTCWAEYGSRRRFGSVLVVDDANRFRKHFARDFTRLFLGIMSVGLVEYHALSRCRIGLSGQRGPAAGTPEARLAWLKRQLDLLLDVEVRAGAGLVSPRHGAQMFYERVAAGLGLQAQRRDMRELLRIKSDMIGAELQEAETKSQQDLERTLKIIGAFFAGSFSFLALFGVVAWEGGYNWIGLSRSSDALRDAGTGAIMATAIIWGLIVVVLSAVIQRLIAATVRRRRTLRIGASRRST